MTRKEEIQLVSGRYASFAGAYGGIKATITEEKNRAYQSGFISGAKWADENPKSPWISVKDDLPCFHTEMVKVAIENVELNTDRVLVMSDDGTMDVSFMFKPIPYSWRWSAVMTITHWMPIPKLQED